MKIKALIGLAILVGCEGETTEGRLRPLAYITEGGETLQVAEVFYDLERDEKCQVVRVGDKELRCLPLSDTTYISNYYAGSGCSEQFRLATVETCEKSYVRVAAPNEDGCGSRMSIHELLNSHEGPVFYKTTEGACEGREREDRRFLSYGEDIMEQFARVDQMVQ